MKKLLIIMVFLLSIAGALAEDSPGNQAELRQARLTTEAQRAAMSGGFPVLDNQVNIRQVHLQFMAELQRTSMEGIIGYLETVNGTDTTELSRILDDFNAQMDTMETLTTHIALNNALRQMQQMNNDFRMETRAQMTAGKGRAVELLKTVKDALQANNATLENLKLEYWNNHKENTLETFDTRVERAQAVLDKLEENGYDITQAQAKLDEINAMRDDLESALDAKDHLKIRQTHLSILQLSKDLARIVKDMQVKIPQEKRIRHRVEVGSRVLQRTETIISELKQLGINVTDLETLQAQAEADQNAAKDAYDAGNMSAAKEALQKLRTDLLKLKDAYRKLRDQRVLPDDKEHKVEATEEVIQETADDVEDSD